MLFSFELTTDTPENWKIPGLPTTDNYVLFAWIQLNPTPDIKCLLGWVDQTWTHDWINNDATTNTYIGFR